MAKNRKIWLSSLLWVEPVIQVGCVDLDLRSFYSVQRIFEGSLCCKRILCVTRAMLGLARDSCRFGCCCCDLEVIVGCRDGLMVTGIEVFENPSRELV